MLQNAFRNGFNQIVSPAFCSSPTPLPPVCGFAYKEFLSKSRAGLRGGGGDNQFPPPWRRSGGGYPKSPVSADHPISHTENTLSVTSQAGNVYAGGVNQLPLPPGDGWVRDGYNRSPSPSGRGQGEGAGHSESPSERVHAAPQKNACNISPQALRSSELKQISYLLFPSNVSALMNGVDSLTPAAGSEPGRTLSESTGPVSS